MYLRKVFFEISESMLSRYIEQYHILFGSSTGTTTNSNTKFARRLAGRTLVQLNASRGASLRSIKAGLLYLIENPAYKQHYKVGVTVDIEKRLAQYQTYDPYRSFKVVKYDFAIDKSKAEKYILKQKTDEDGLGEWLLKPKALELFNKISIP